MGNKERIKILIAISVPREAGGDDCVKIIDAWDSETGFVLINLEKGEVDLNFMPDDES